MWSVGAYRQFCQEQLQLKTPSFFQSMENMVNDQAALTAPPVTPFLSSDTPSPVEDESLPRAASPTIVVLCCFWTMSR